MLYQTLRSVSDNHVEVIGLSRNRLRMATTPPGYCSGLALIFREPQAEHFMCLPTSGTGISGGNGTVAGLTSRSQQLVFTNEIAERDGASGIRHSLHQ